MTWSTSVTSKKSSVVTLLPPPAPGDPWSVPCPHNFDPADGAQTPTAGGLWLLAFSMMHLRVPDAFIYQESIPFYC